LIGGASVGASYRFLDSDVARWLRTSAGAGRVKVISGHLIGIGRGTYRSVAPYPLLVRKADARLRQGSVLGEVGALGLMGRPVMRGLGLPDREKTGKDGFFGGGSSFRGLGNLRPALGNRFRPLEVQTTSGKVRALARRFAAGPASRVSAFPAKHLSAGRVALQGGSGLLRAEKTTDALRSLAPIRAMAGAEKLREDRATGVLHQYSPAGSQKVTQTEPFARVRVPTETRTAGASTWPVGDVEQGRASAASVGKAVEAFFAEQVRLPPSGMSGFDPRLSPAWAGLQIPG